MSILAFDVGGSAIKYALMEKNASILCRGEEKTPMTSIEDFVEVVKKIYQPLADKVTGLAFSMPGIMSVESGYMVQGGALLYWAGNNFYDEITKHINLPISIENDAFCAALAEIWLGNLTDVDDAIVMLLGTGIGGALVINRKIHRGHHNFSGEFSYILSGNPLTDGMEASFAYKASAVGFVKRVAQAKGEEIMTGHQVFDLIENGDEVALPLFQEYAMSVAVQLFNLQAIFDPQKILIGGGISARPILIETINQILQGMYQMVPPTTPRAVIQTCKHHNDSNLYGALYNYLVLYNHI